jgi:TPP-dependent pyruvate/acetoin dehydrogenase alpha subunit
MGNITKQQLINFEDSIKQLWESGELKCLCHFAGGNEDQLIEYFKCVGEDDWCFSTWRSSYHFLLKTGDFEYLYDQIVNKNNSMHITDVSRRFVSSAIVGGTCAMAVGVANALKLAGKASWVHCFIGDGGTDQGWFSEALKYAEARDLPITFVIENNDRSVESSIAQRWGNELVSCKQFAYDYEPTYPHVGSGKWVQFL